MVIRPKCPPSSSSAVIVCDVDGEFTVGTGAPESDLLSDDHDDATVGGAAFHGDGFE